MKVKSKSVSRPARVQSQINNKVEPNFKAWRQTGLRLAAIFLIIVFLASECAVLIPGQ